MVVDVELQPPSLRDVLLDLHDLPVQHLLILRIVKGEDVLARVVERSQRGEVLVVHQAEVQALVELAPSAPLYQPAKDVHVVRVGQDVVVHEVDHLAGHSPDDARHPVVLLDLPLILRHLTEPAVPDASPSYEAMAGVFIFKIERFSVFNLTGKLKVGIV